MAIGLAAVVQARDRLLADVAALLEVDRALVEPCLLRDRRLVDVDPVARPAALDAQDLGGRLGDRRAPRARRAPARRPPPRRRRRPRGRWRRAPPGRRRSQPPDWRARRAPTPPRRRRPPRRRARRARRAPAAACACAAAPPADHAAAQRVEEHLQCDALGVEPQLAAGAQHAQVGEHLALVGQQRRVAAAAGRQRLDVVADLAVEHLGRLGPGQGELAARGAVDERDLLGDEAVGGGERLDGCDGHRRQRSPMPV